MKDQLDLIKRKFSKRNESLHQKNDFDNLLNLNQNYCSTIIQEEENNKYNELKNFNTKKKTKILVKNNEISLKQCYVAELKKNINSLTKKIKIKGNTFEGLKIQHIEIEETLNLLISHHKLFLFIILQNYLFKIQKCFEKQLFKNDLFEIKGIKSVIIKEDGHIEYLFSIKDKV